MNDNLTEIGAVIYSRLKHEAKRLRRSFNVDEFQEELLAEWLRLHPQYTKDSRYCAEYEYDLFIAVNHWELYDRAEWENLEETPVISKSEPLTDPQPQPQRQCVFALEQMEYIDNTTDFECLICLGPWEDPIELSCGHILCAGCTTGLTVCPMCLREVVISKKSPNRLILNLLGRLRQRCKLCAWEGPRESAPSHECMGHLLTPFETAILSSACKGSRSLQYEELAVLSRRMNIPRTFPRDLPFQQLCGWIKANRPDPMCLYGLTPENYLTVLRQFSVLDKDCDGFLNRQELTQLCRAMGQKWPQSQKELDDFFHVLSLTFGHGPPNNEYSDLNRVLSLRHYFDTVRYLEPTVLNTTSCFSPQGSSAEIPKPEEQKKSAVKRSREEKGDDNPTHSSPSETRKRVGWGLTPSLCPHCGDDKEYLPGALARHMKAAHKQKVDADGESQHQDLSEESVRNLSEKWAPGTVFHYQYIEPGSPQKTATGVVLRRNRQGWIEAAYPDLPDYPYERFPPSGIIHCSIESAGVLPDILSEADIVKLGLDLTNFISYEKVQKIVGMWDVGTVCELVWSNPVHENNYRLHGIFRCSKGTVVERRSSHRGKGPYIKIILPNGSDIGTKRHIFLPENPGRGTDDDIHVYDIRADNPKLIPQCSPRSDQTVIGPYLDIFPPHPNQQMNEDLYTTRLLEHALSGPEDDAPFFLFGSSSANLLTRRSLCTLRPGQRVSNLVVDVFVRLCAEGSHGKVGADYLSNWGNPRVGLPLFTSRPELIFAPVWFEKEKHFALCVADVGLGKLHYLDPLASTMEPPTKEINLFGKKCSSRFENHFEVFPWLSTIPAQSGDSDCGIFVCMYAFAICYRSGQMNFSMEDMVAARRAITLVFTATYAPIFQGESAGTTRDTPPTEVRAKRKDSQTEMTTVVPVAQKVLDVQPPPTGWACDKCTMRNMISDKRCSICLALKIANAELFFD